MKKGIMIIAAAFGMFIICAIIVMFMERHEKARSALCLQCHMIEDADTLKQNVMPKNNYLMDERRTK
jgi:nitrate/TMAO reductase-like tetraheme cytochrome c subunit